MKDFGLLVGAFIGLFFIDKKFFKVIFHIKNKDIVLLLKYLEEFI